MKISFRRAISQARAAAASVALVTVLVGCGEEPPYARFDAPWTRFVEGDGMAGAYDASRLVTHGDTVLVWMRFRYARPQRLPGDTARTFSITDVHLAVRCEPELTRDVRMLIRDSLGDSLGGYTTPAPRWMPFTEHGLSDRVLVRLCRALPPGEGR